MYICDQTQNMDPYLKQLFENWAKQEILSYTALPRSGSDRQYFRIMSESKTAIGVKNHDLKENEAFLGFTRHFRDKKLPVADIYAEDLPNHVYLLEDLGDTTLFKYISSKKETKGFGQENIQLYKKILDYLPQFQIGGNKGLNYDLCYPRSKFDKQSMMWDLNYFKYYFLKLAGIPFDEAELEKDFQVFAEYLMAAEHDYFLYRDFQSRNIMIREGQIYFIDYQGGRKGALQYDLASLLYDAKANIPPQTRAELLDYYISSLKKYIQVDEQQFRSYFSAFVMIRIMQAMGAYGFRGFYEKKPHFLASIPYALDNLKLLLEEWNSTVKLPALLPLLEALTQSDKLRKLAKPELTVSVNSFSFKRAIPYDESENGGGHVFDCRALPNPGRYISYAHLTGKDQTVIDFLKKEEAVAQFFEHCKMLTEISVDNYLERGFQNLQINFGCTGGQHRSVYLAEMMTKHLKEKYNLNVPLRHREQELKKTI